MTSNNNIPRWLIFLPAFTMIGIWLLLPVVAGFATTSLSSRQEFSMLTPHRSQLHASRNSADSSDFKNGGENWDVESARRQLEDMMDGASSFSRGDDTSAVADKLFPIILTEQKPQLTAIARVRRTAEIQLLSQIEQYTVEAADALNDLWLNERGGRAAKELSKADDIFQQGESSWNKAEDSFLNLIHEYGPYWVEPLHRLSMLYYLQGRLDEARELEEFVLTIKPWHIGSLSNYVRIAESQRDTQTALQWAARRLPPDDRRRGEWAQHAVHDAINQLSRDERRLRTFFGKPFVVPEDEPWQ